MTIQQFSTVEEEKQAFLKALSQLAQLNRIPAGLQPLGFRIPVFSLTPSKVEGLPSPDESPEAWRYFAGGDSADGTVSGDVDLTKTPAVRNLTYGATAYNALNAYVKLGGLFPDNPDTFSARYIQIPSLCVEAFGLLPAGIDRSAAKTIVVPFHSAAEILRREGTFRGGDFSSVIQGIAKTVGEQSDSTRPHYKEYR